MKKILFLTSLTVSLAVLTLSCSSDDDANSNCESCTSDLGTKFEICDSRDGAYSLKVDGEETGTILQSQLESAGFSSTKEYIQTICTISTAGL